jgi:hypothetical protein
MWSAGEPAKKKLFAITTKGSAKPLDDARRYMHD